MEYAPAAAAHQLVPGGDHFDLDRSGRLCRPIHSADCPNSVHRHPHGHPQPESFITDAENLFTEGKLFQSIDTYLEAIRIKPDDASSAFALAHVQVLPASMMKRWSMLRMRCCLTPITPWHTPCAAGR